YAVAPGVDALSIFIVDSPRLIASKMFVVKDANGFYALSAKCTHEGAVVKTSGGNFLCPRHGAEFTYDGDIVSGPVFTGLVHYAMCVLGNGNLGVMTGTTVSQSTRLVVGWRSSPSSR